jgi:hypothetical protein
MLTIRAYLNIKHNEKEKERKRKQRVPAHTGVLYRKREAEILPGFRLGLSVQIRAFRRRTQLRWE